MSVLRLGNLYGMEQQSYWFSHDNCRVFSLASSRPLFASDFACKDILESIRKSPCRYFLARILEKCEKEKIHIFITILLKNKQ